MSCDSCGCDCQDEPQQVIYGCLCGCEAVDPQPFGRMYGCHEAPHQGPMTAFQEAWSAVSGPLAEIQYADLIAYRDGAGSGVVTGLAAWLPTTSERIVFGVER